MQDFSIFLLLLAALTISTSTSQDVSVVKTTQVSSNLLWELPIGEHVMRFDDLYYIQTYSRNKSIIIHCNAAYCYKQRSKVLLS